MLKELKKDLLEDLDIIKSATPKDIAETIIIGIITIITLYASAIFLLIIL